MRRYKRMIEELDRFLVTNWSFINSPSAKVRRRTFSVAEWKAFIIAKYHVDALAAALCVRFKHFDNQLPVGLFSGKLANKTQVIPAHRSTIDLWGIDDTGAAHIFKLKDDRNRKIGIISELLFYVYVVTGVQKGTFCHTPDNAAAVFRKTFMENGEKLNIKAHFLVPGLHPIITPEVITLLNSHLADTGVSFDAWKYDSDFNFAPYWGEK